MPPRPKPIRWIEVRDFGDKWKARLRDGNKVGTPTEYGGRLEVIRQIEQEAGAASGTLRVVEFGTERCADG